VNPAVLWRRSRYQVSCGQAILVLVIQLKDAQSSMHASKARMKDDARLKPTCTSLLQCFVKVKPAEGGDPMVEREV
jgi:hypothetical protein